MVKTKRNIKGSDTGHSVKLAILFCLLVGGLILISLTAKILVIVKNSMFDGEHRFTVVVEEENASSTIISFSPVNESVSLLRVHGVENISLVGKTIETPIDGQIGSHVKIDKDVPGLLASLLFRYPSLKTNLTIIDLARLWWFASQLPKHAYSQKAFSLENSEGVYSDATIDKLSSQLFADETIAHEKMSVQIVNAAGASGLGSRFARLVNNMGGNVVSVITAENETEKTIIHFYGNKSYTVTRLEKILGVVATPLSEPQIADIIVTIGKDRQNAQGF